MSSESPPTVSFIVMAYNTEKYVIECLDSIKNMNIHCSYEVLIGNDCSTDRTNQLISQWLMDNANLPVKYINRVKNIGALENLKDLVQQSRGSFIARIDSDDYYVKDFLQTMMPILLDHEDVMMAFADSTLVDPDSNVTGKTDSAGKPGKVPNPVISLLKRNFVNAPTVLLRTQCWQNQLDDIDDLEACDWYLNILCALRGNLYYQNSVVANYRVHPEGMHATSVQTKGEFWAMRTIELVRKKVSIGLLQTMMVVSAQSVYWAERYYSAGKYRLATSRYIRCLINNPFQIIRSPRRVYHFIKSLAKSAWA